MYIAEQPLNAANERRILSFWPPILECQSQWQLARLSIRHSARERDGGTERQMARCTKREFYDDGHQLIIRSNIFLAIRTTVGICQKKHKAASGLRMNGKSGSHTHAIEMMRAIALTRMAARRLPPLCSALLVPSFLFYANILPAAPSSITSPSNQILTIRDGVLLMALRNSDRVTWLH